MLKLQKNSKGFTLIELLIVIAIIGILAAIALPAYMDYAKKARLSKALATIGAVKTGLTAYAAEASGGPAAITAAAFGSAALISQNAGVSIPPKYITDMAALGTAAGATLTTTLQGIDSAVNGKTLILSSNNANLQTWTWSDTSTLYTDTATRKFMPKN